MPGRPPQPWGNLPGHYRRRRNCRRWKRQAGEFELFGRAARIRHSPRQEEGRRNPHAPGLASQCLECGPCLEKRPQGIPIPDVLKRVAAEMEGEDIEEGRGWPRPRKAQFRSGRLEFSG